VARTHVGGSGDAGFLTGAVWAFEAPAGTTITRVTVWRSGIKYRTGADDTGTDGDDGDTRFLGAQEFNGNVVGGGFGESCNVPASGATCTLGAPGGVGAASEKTYDVSTRRLTWQIFCRQLFGTGGCPRYYGVSTASMTLFGAGVTLTDDSAPSLSAGGPVLAGGWHRPGESIAIDASDNSGIRATRAEAGGASSGGRACDFTRTVPCSDVAGGSLPLPAAPDGQHAVQITAEDAAGNTTATERTVLIDGTPPLARLDAPRGRVLRVKVDDGACGDVLRGSRGVGVQVPASSTIRASRTVLGGPGRVGFRGRLRTGGASIPDRGLVVVLQGRADGRWQTFADTRTDRRGRWRAGYRFRGIPGRYPVRTRIPPQAGFPYELGYSRTVSVRVR